MRRTVGKPLWLHRRGEQGRHASIGCTMLPPPPHPPLSDCLTARRCVWQVGVKEGESDGRHMRVMGQM